MSTMRISAKGCATVYPLGVPEHKRHRWFRISQLIIDVRNDNLQIVCTQFRQLPEYYLKSKHRIHLWRYSNGRYIFTSKIFWRWSSKLYLFVSNHLGQFVTIRVTQGKTRTTLRLTTQAGESLVTWIAKE